MYKRQRLDGQLNVIGKQGQRIKTLEDAEPIKGEKGDTGEAGKTGKTGYFLEKQVIFIANRFFFNGVHQPGLQAASQS